MNLLLILAMLLAIFITVMVIRAYFQEKITWMDIKEKASQSGIKEFSE